MASTPPPRIAASVSSHSCRRARSSLSSSERRFTSAAPGSVLFCLGTAIRGNWDSELMQDVSRVLANADEGPTRRRFDLNQAGSGDDVVLTCHSRLLVKIDYLKLASSFGEHGSDP